MMANQIDILLYGLGGIGSFYAFILSRSPNIRLTVVARSNYEAVKASGLTIDSQNHGKHTIHPFKVIKSPSEAPGHYDYVVCAHKAIDQESVLKALEPVVDENTTLVIMQNGVGNEDPFRSSWPKSSILTCVIWVSAKQTAPGVIAHTKAEHLQIGLYPNETLGSTLEKQRLDDFAALLHHGKTSLTVEDDMQLFRWKKLVWNVAWNSLTTLTMVDTQTWLHSSPQALTLTRTLMREVIDVGCKAGVALRYELIDELMEKILAMPGIGSSMQVDAKAGRPIEVDVILGVPVRKGRELGVEIPTLETIYTLLLAVDSGMRKPST